jgi:hypothetical protein
VRGRVTYRGQGIPKAIVIFHPAQDALEKAKKLRPFAYADNQGNFELKTYVNGDGAPPGKYRVSIIAVGGGRSGGIETDQPAAESEVASTGPVSIPPAVTKKYGSPETSGIEVTVQEGENNLEPFDLAPEAGAPRQSARSSGAGAALIRN